MTLSRGVVHRIACAVVAAEARRWRDRDLIDGAGPWPEALPLGDDGLGLDSLERLGALAALAEVFALDDASLPALPPATVGAWLNWIMAAQARTDGQLVVRTSGSTGTPKSCAHRLVDLTAEAADLAMRFAGRRRVVSLVPAQHLYGIIWTVLLPNELAVPVVVRAIGASVGLMPGDLVVAVPEQWRAVRQLIRRFPSDVIGVSSAGPLDGGLAAELLAAGLTRLVDVYGCSEMGGIALRDAPDDRLELLPRWRLVRRDDGEWGLEDGDGRGWPLPDRVEPVGPRGLRLGGRRDGAVQVGGHNVFPERVARVLRGLDGVADAAVRLGADGRLKAFVVPTPGSDAARLASSIDQLVADRLPPHERPRSIRCGGALPCNAMGKAEDWT